MVNRKKDFAIPNKTQCKRLWKIAGTPYHVQKHCQAVALKANELAGQLPNISLDIELLYTAALLHDIARTESDHAKKGAFLLTKMGYPEIGQIIASHHDLTETDLTISEALILYLADKMVLGERTVSLEERFAKSAIRCTTEAAKEAHLQRYQQAKQVEQLVLDAIANQQLCVESGGVK